MGDKGLAELVREKSEFFTAERRLPQENLEIVLKKVLRLANSHSPVNCSKNFKAISSNIDMAIDVNKVYHKDFNMKIEKEYEKLNSKPSENRLARTTVSPLVTEEKKYKLKSKIKFPKVQTRFLTKKPEKLKSLQEKKVENLINQCNFLDKDMRRSRVMSVDLAFSQFQMKEILLNYENYSKRLQDEKYLEIIRKNPSKLANMDSSTVLTKKRKFWKHNHIRFISDINSQLHIKPL